MSPALPETRQQNSGNNGSTRSKRKCRTACNYNEDTDSESERETPAKKQSEESIPETNDRKQGKKTNSRQDSDTDLGTDSGTDSGTDDDRAQTNRTTAKPTADMTDRRQTGPQINRRKQRKDEGKVNASDKHPSGICGDKILLIVVFLTALGLLEPVILFMLAFEKKRSEDQAFDTTISAVCSLDQARENADGAQSWEIKANAPVVRELCDGISVDFGEILETYLTSAEHVSILFNGMEKSRPNMKYFKSRCTKQPMTIGVLLKCVFSHCLRNRLYPADCLVTKRAKCHYGLIALLQW